MKKLLAMVLAALFLVGGVALAAGQEYTLESIRMKLTVPEGYTVLTRDMAEDDPAFAQLGTTKEEIEELFAEQEIYLNVIISEESGEEIALTVSENDYSKRLFSFADQNEEFFDEVAANIQDESSTEEYGLKYYGYQKYEHPQTVFLRFDFEQTGEDSVSYGRQYYTVFNGQYINLLVRSYDGEFSEEAAQVLDEMVQSLTFTEVVANSTTIRYIVIFAVVAVALVVYAVYLRRKRKKEAQA